MSSNRIKPPAIWKKTTSTTIIPTNRNGTNEEENNASSARIQHPSSATTARTRSPRKMKTQIAKLVYNPSTATAAKSNNQDVVVNENENPIVVAEVEEFQKKRQDRDKEVKEIQEMLNEITKSPTKQTKKAEEEPQKVVVTKHSPTKPPTNSFQRSKTDTNLRRPTARKSQPRQEAQTARSKSVHTEESSSPPKQRQKTYNSEEAQRYMQEQKKKRRSLQSADSKPAIDKDEIKKRLENLRQNTRKILSKNVKIAKKKSGAVEDNQILRREEPRNGMDKEIEVPDKTARVEAWPERLLKAPSPLRDETKNEVVKEPEAPAKISSIEPWADKVIDLKSPPGKQQQDPSPLSANHKKVGLLRKPEFKDHSFSAIKDINMDKENLIIDILTPQISGHPTSRFREMNKEQENLVSDILTPQILENRTSRLKDSVKDTATHITSNTNLEQKPSESILSSKSLKRKNSPELDLKVPAAKLRSRTSLREKSTQIDSSLRGSFKTDQKNAELPYWLKPTSVQAYPYNFIMAVRKKLENIANPPAVASSSSSSMEHQVAKKTSTETPVSYPKTNRNNAVKRRIIDNEDKSLAKSIEKLYSNKENIGEARLSRSFSEVTSNFSSMSIQLPDSQKTISSPKLKPLLEEKKSLRFDEDDTTVSSSILSSPEKKSNFNGRSKNVQPEALSPLSMDNISNLHIKSKSMVSNITLGRGDSFVDTSSHRRGTISHRSDDSVDFSQLLDDFNRSLSQVIEVNQQLKTTLVKSQIFSPERKNTNTVLTTANLAELPEYVSDFEESSNAAEEEKQKPKESNRTQNSTAIPEVQSSSKQSSEINTERSFSNSSSNEEIPEEEYQSSAGEEMQSPLSLETQTFTVSSEEQGQTSTRTRTVHEEAIEESPNKENMSGNQYSLDSLETSPQDQYIKSHINTSRGDYKGERCELLSAGPPPSYKLSSESQACTPPNFINSSMDNEFVRVFNKSDMEISVLSLNRSLSESTVNYSSIGMYEKLIQNETNKSEHLAALLKMREKALIDRTKGQIAWLEVQKERYKAKGLILQISAVKKKQRGILLKMEKEREEIKKLLQQAKVQRDDNKLRIPEIRPSSDVTLFQQRRAGIQASPASQHKQQQSNLFNQQQRSSARSKSSSAIVRGYELETSRSLEQLLQKREEDLRRRREHVERLMEWHRRLDQEEAEVLQLERILLDYNNVHVQQQQEHEENVVVQERNPNQTKMEKKLKEIDRSLRELSSISGADASTDAGRGSGEYVRTTGSKLNKLWRRLTSQRIEKFQPNKRYKLCKADVEQLYEDAKLAVLQDFGENAGQMEVFLGQTSIISTPQASSLSMEIPQLNLNFSSGQSEDDMMRGNYSPSAAEEGFVVASTSSREGLSDESGSKRRAISVNSSSSALQWPDNDKSSSACAKILKKSTVPQRFQNDQALLLNNEQNPSASRLGITNKSKGNVENIASGSAMKSGFSAKSETASKISINYVLSPKKDNDPRMSASNSMENMEQVENTGLLKSISANKNVPNKVSSSSSGSDLSYLQENASKTSQRNSNSNESTKNSISLVAQSNIPEIFGHTKTESQQTISQAVSSGSTKTFEDASNTIAGTESLINTGSEQANTSKDRSSIPDASRSIEILSEISGGSVPEITACTDTRSDQNRSKANSQIETAASISSGKPKASHSNVVESESTKKYLPEISDDSTKSNHPNETETLLHNNSSINLEKSSGQTKSEKIQNRHEEDVVKTEVSDRIDGSVTSILESVSKTAKNSSANSSDNVPITETNQSVISQTPTESLKTSSSLIKSQTLESASCTKSNSSTENTTIPDFGTKTEPEASNSHTEIQSLIKTKTKSEETIKTNTIQTSQTDAFLPKIAPPAASSSSRFAEESATVSILKSLLNSTYNSNSSMISDHASKNVSSDIQAHLSIHGHQLENWSKSPIQSNEITPPSPKDEQSKATASVSRTESLSYADEGTLRSIKSIDNSTNSKHSIDQVSNSATALSENAISNQTANSLDLRSEGIPQSYSSAFEDTVSSNQIRSSVIMSIKSPPPQVGAGSEPLTNSFYESDFTEGEETNIDDLSLPKFETTAEEEQLNESQLSPAANTTEFEKRLIDLDVSLKDLDATFEKALSPEKTPSPPRDDGSKKSQQQNDSALMPDIISEVELRRRHQAMLENELKQFEHAVPYMYVREIPNKPPPPYVPPAHGSPMTTIFPSEERIKDITFRRTKELYYEILNIDTKDENGKKTPSVLDENITNIYERIILDICKEYLTDYKPILASADPNNFHSPLAFFNPPDRLRCMQDFIYKEVRKSLAMDKNAPKKSQVYSVYGHRGKRDHIGEIIIQEMYEEDDIWSNFYVEEEEVLELIIDEIVGVTVRDIANEVLEDEVPRDSITPTPDADESVEMRCNST